MPSSVAPNSRVEISIANDNQCCMEQSTDITHRTYPVTMTLYVLGTLAVIGYWLFLMLAMPETQPVPTVFVDR
jgi:hypothetical protein